MREKKTVEIRTCDNCGKETSDNGEQTFGGSVFNGWFEVKKVCHSSAIIHNEKQKLNFDLCSLNCLEEFAKIKQV